MQSILQYDHDYLVCGNHNYKIVILLQYSYPTKQDSENIISNLFPLQDRLHLIRHYITVQDVSPMANSYIALMENEILEMMAIEVVSERIT